MQKKKKSFEGEGVLGFFTDLLVINDYSVMSKIFFYKNTFFTFGINKI